MALITKGDIVRKMKNDLGLPSFQLINEAAKVLIPTYIVNPLANPIPIGFHKPDPDQTPTVVSGLTAVSAATDTSLYTVPSGKSFYANFFVFYNADLNDAITIKDGTTTLVAGGLVCLTTTNTILSPTTPLKFTNSIVIRFAGAKTNFQYVFWGWLE